MRYIQHPEKFMGKSCFTIINKSYNKTIFGFSMNELILLYQQVKLITLIISLHFIGMPFHINFAIEILKCILILIRLQLMISNRMLFIYILQIFDIVISLFTLFNNEFCMVTSSWINCDVKIFMLCENFMVLYA